MGFEILNDLTEQMKRDYPNDEINIFCFPQIWGSSALGYGGVGASAMSKSTTIVICAEYANIYRVYFGSDRLAYELKDPNRVFMDDLFSMNLKEKSQSKFYNREE